MISKKGAQNFLKNMAEIYRRAHKSAKGNSDSRIVRGRAHCVAADFEDEFADLVCKKILWRKESKIRVFSDFPLTIEPSCRNEEKMKESRYIDVMICSEQAGHIYKILYMAELKTNTGWIRDKVEEHLEDNLKLIKHMKRKNTKLSVRRKSLKGVCVEEDFERISFVVSESLRYDVVILSSANNNSAWLNKLKSNKRMCSRLIVLTDDSLDEVQQERCDPIPRYQDFKELNSRVEGCLGR